MSLNVSQEDIRRQNTGADRQSQGAISGNTLYHSMPNTDSSGSRSNWTPESTHMSPARRTFCLVTTFDLILTFILWVIYTQLIGITPIWSAFQDQVFKYTFEKSLFDTVMIATARFTFIMLAYALFRISHWWVIAISTLMTCVYLLCKCFMFEFNDSVLGGKNPLSYVLLIVCFVLAWIETWFLDFKVIPREKAYSRGITDPERQSLLHSRDRRYASTQSIEDTREYYSPFHTPEGSEDEGDHHHHHHHPGHHHGHHKGSISSTHSRKELEHYNQILSEAKEAFLEMFHMEGWKLESGKNLQEGLIYSQNIKKFGRKIFKLQGIINMAPQDLWEDMVSTLNDSPKWNPTILESRSLQALDDHTEITYNITADAAGGLVSSRDFVSIRQWSQIEPGLFISGGTGCTHPDMPVQKKYVRGDNGPGGWTFEAIPGEPDKCLFTWIVNTNLKGWLPQAAIDQAMSGVLSTYFKLLIAHYEEIIEQRAHGS